MLSFISEENYNMHVDYLSTLRNRRSLASKGALDTNTAGFNLLRRRGNKSSWVNALCREIMLHEVYFDSFTEREYVRSPTASHRFGSENELLAELYKLGMENRHGFVGIQRTGKGGLELLTVSDLGGVELYEQVLLAVDVCEHAYFYDYGFNKGEYLKRALRRLALSRLDEFS